MAHNLARVAGALSSAESGRASVATLRHTLFTIPGRLVRYVRRLHPRLPANWPLFYIHGGGFTGDTRLPATMRWPSGTVDPHAAPHRRP